MAQKATVRLGWTKSVSADVEKTIVKINNDNILSEVEVGNDVEEIQITVKASTTLIFSIITIDHDGVETESTIYNFTFGDLVAPQPATNLFHEILNVFEEPDEDDEEDEV